MNLSELNIKVPQPSVLYKVSRFPNIDWLKQLRDNSSTFVSCETGDPYGKGMVYEAESDAWLGDLVEDIIQNIDYITCAPRTETYHIEPDGTIKSMVLDAKNDFEFKGIEELKEYIKTLKYKGIMLYSIQCSVIFGIQKGTCESHFKIRYAEYEDIKATRDRKLDELIKE